MSFINDCVAVKGIQSPKQPQVRILPDSTAYPVKKVKKIMSNNNSQLKNLTPLPDKIATPTITSNVIVMMENANA